MARWCVVKKCKNKIKGKMKESITLHKFPRTPDLLQKWEDWVNTVNGLCDPLKIKQFKSYKSAELCSGHFDPSCFKFGQLQRYSVPSIPSTENTCETLDKIVMNASNKTFELPHDAVSILNPIVTINTDDRIIHSELSIEKNKTKNNDNSTIDIMSKKSQRKFYLGDFTEEDLMTSREKRTFLDVVQEHMKKTRIRIKILNERNRRLYKENMKLKCVLQKLKEDRLPKYIC